MLYFCGVDRVPEFEGSDKNVNKMMIYDSDRLIVSLRSFDDYVNGLFELENADRDKIKLYKSHDGEYHVTCTTGTDSVGLYGNGYATSMNFLCFDTLPRHIVDKDNDFIINIYHSERAGWSTRTFLCFDLLLNGYHYYVNMHNNIGKGTNKIEFNDIMLPETYRTPFLAEYNIDAERFEILLSNNDRKKEYIHFTREGIVRVCYKDLNGLQKRYNWDDMKEPMSIEDFNKISLRRKKKQLLM